MFAFFSLSRCTVVADAMVPSGFGNSDERVVISCQFVFGALYRKCRGNIDIIALIIVKNSLDSFFRSVFFISLGN